MELGRVEQSRAELGIVGVSSEEMSGVGRIFDGVV